MSSAPLTEFTYYTRSERIADNVIHVIGIAASVIAVSAMIYLAFVWRDAATIVSVSIFGLSTVAVFSISAAYHLTPPSERKAILRRFDHAAIFVKIAGTYTPLAWIIIGGSLGFWLLVVVWTIAVVGATLKLSGWRAGGKLSVALYLAQGWLIILAIKPLREGLEASELALCMAGGAIYTLGCAFYLAKKMPFNNAIWHGMVVLASACFYVAILKAVVLR